MRHTTLVWHRHDLRLSDNHLYRDLDRCLSVYVFDPAAFARVPSCAQPEWDVTRTGPHAAQLHETLDHPWHRSVASSRSAVPTLLLSPP